MNARELERRMVEQFGEDFRDKTINGWPLRETFAECGLKDPKAPPPASSQGFGLFQMLPGKRPRVN